MGKQPTTNNQQPAAPAAPAVPREFARYIQPTEAAEVVTLTRPLVDWLLAINTHNRTIKAAVVQRYREELERGNWSVTSQGIGVSREGVLVDGQHRLLAIRAAGYPAVRTLLVYGLDPSVQLKVDTHAKRDLADRLALALDISANKTQAGALAILWTIDEGRTAATTATPLSALCETFEHYRAAWEALPFRTSARGLTAAFVAACILAVSRGVAADAARDFVHAFTTGESLAARNPVLLLRQRMFAEPSITGRRAPWFSLTLRALILFAQDDPCSCLKVIPVADAVGLLDEFARRHGRPEVLA